MGVTLKYNRIRGKLYKTTNRHSGELSVLEMVLWNSNKHWTMSQEYCCVQTVEEAVGNIIII